MSSLVLGKQLQMQRSAIGNRSKKSNLANTLFLVTVVCHLAFICLIHAQGFEAAYDPNFPPNTYRSEQNPYYWRNSAPPGDYWQQDVQYKIDATFDEKAEVIRGRVDVTYWNNSTQQIREIHLQLGDLLTPESEGFVKIEKVVHLRTRKTLSATTNPIDSNKLAKKRAIYHLGQILNPGDFARVQIDFVTHFDHSTAESALEILKNPSNDEQPEMAIKAGNWFPKLVNFNANGWDDSSQASPFGTFNVKLDFPGNFLLFSSAQLSNGNRVYDEKLDELIGRPDSLSTQTDSLINLKSKERKIWKYHRENSNNFAFVASPYIRRIARKNGNPQLNFYTWGPSSLEEEMMNSLATRLGENSKKYGLYPYSQLNLFALRGSQAFPMLNFVSGSDESLSYISQALLDAQWFGGLIAAKDQKSQDLLTAIVQYLSLTEEKNRALMRQVLYDGFREARESEEQVKNYWTEIDKYTLALFYLEDEFGQFYVTGQIAKFAKSWRFRHVETNDFWQYFYSMRSEKLNQYIGQFDEENVSIDYAIDSSSLKKVENGIYRLKIIRKGNLHVPIEFAAKDLTGKITKFYIPATEKRNTRLEGKKLRMWTMEDGDIYEEDIKIPYGLKSIKLRGRLAYVDCFIGDNALPKKKPDEKKKKKNKKKRLGKKKGKNNKKK